MSLPYIYYRYLADTLLIPEIDDLLQVRDPIKRRGWLVLGVGCVNSLGWLGLGYVHLAKFVRLVGLPRSKIAL